MTFALSLYNNGVFAGVTIDLAVGFNFNRAYGRETVTFPRPKKMQKGFDLGFCSGDVIRINGTFTDGWAISPQSNIMKLFNGLILYKGPHIIHLTGINWTVLVKSLDATSEPGQGSNIITVGMVFDVIDIQGDNCPDAFVGCQTY